MLVISELCFSVPALLLPRGGRGGLGKGAGRGGGRDICVRREERRSSHFIETRWVGLLWVFFVVYLVVHFCSWSTCAEFLEEVYEDADFIRVSAVARRIPFAC